MKKYKVMYKDINIGTLTLEENRHIYIPDKVGIEKAKKNGDTILNHLKEITQEKTIPFFESRLQNAERFKNVSIGYHTDNYELIEEK